MNRARNSSQNLLNQGPYGDNEISNNTPPISFRGRVKTAPKENGMGSILSYAGAGKYREDTSRMGGVTGKTNSAYQNWLNSNFKPTILIKKI